MKTCQVVDWGRMEYGEALRRQEELVERRRQGEGGDILVLVEHDPVITLGRRGTWADILADGKLLAREGIAVYETNRGGEVTYHGPGQLVGYPILDLQALRWGVHAYLRGLEEVLIRTLADFGVAGGRLTGLTGVWVGKEKIAAIGVALRRWITMHGFALNVNVDLRPFAYIIPCGQKERGVTSLAQQLGRPVPLRGVKRRLIERFGEVFNLRMQDTG